MKSNSIISFKYYLSLCLLISISCSVDIGQKENKNKGSELSENSYASAFSIEEKDSTHFIKVMNSSGDWAYSYALSNNNEVEDNTIKIELPLKRIAVISSTYLSFIDELKALSKVCAISGSQYMHHDSIIYGLSDSSIIDIGFEAQMSLEKIIKLKPDIILAYESAKEPKFWNRLKNLGIPVVFIHEYLEPHPLGKLEWIRVFGLLLDKKAEANAYYKKVCLRYDSLKNSIKGQKRPSVLTNMLWSGSWYLPGGNSYMAQLINDAGGDYILSADTNNTSQAKSFETVLNIGFEAEKWIHLNQINSLNELKIADERYAHFKAYKEKQVYNNNALKNEKGGILFYEKGTIEPHIILEDLIHIFHNELNPKHKLTYYQHLK